MSRVLRGGVCTALTAMAVALALSTAPARVAAQSLWGPSDPEGPAPASVRAPPPQRGFCDVHHAGCMAFGRSTLWSSVGTVSAVVVGLQIYFLAQPPGPNQATFLALLLLPVPAPVVGPLAFGVFNALAAGPGAASAALATLGIGTAIAQAVSLGFWIAGERGSPRRARARRTAWLLAPSVAATGAGLALSVTHF